MHASTTTVTSGSLVRVELNRFHPVLYRFCRSPRDSGPARVPHRFYTVAGPRLSCPVRETQKKIAGIIVARTLRPLTFATRNDSFALVEATARRSSLL